MRITFKGNGIVWDAARKKNLCKFKSVGYVEGVYQIGEFTTDDSRTIELLKDYPTVPADAMEYYWKEKESKENQESGLDEPKDLKDYTVKELKAYAKGNGIDLGDARNKKDILATIKEE